MEKQIEKFTKLCAVFDIYKHGAICYYNFTRFNEIIKSYEQ